MASETGTAITVQAPGVELAGDLVVPADALGVVVFAHGTGSGRHSPRNRMVATGLRDAGFATLLLDLLTEREEQEEAPTGRLRFDIGLLATRLVAAVDRLATEPGTSDLPVGTFGASTGAAAALLAAVERPGRVRAVVSRGGRPDLAEDALERVTVPVLLIVGGADPVVQELNEAAATRLSCDHALVVVPGATHLFAEPGALETVTQRATGWFRRFLPDG